MAVYDAYGTQQFYFPNVLKYDPDQLRQQLEDLDGAKNIQNCRLHDGVMTKMFAVGGLSVME